VNLTDKKETKEIKKYVEKWGRTNISAGWTIIPNSLLENQARLGLSCIDMMVLINLITHWWEKDNAPRPAKKRLANILGVSTKTIQRSMVNLEQCGALKRLERYRDGGDGGRTTNNYDLNPLVDVLTPFSAEIITDKKQKQKSEITRPTRRGRGEQKS
jgi:predicted transcriptional regulator